MRALVRVAKTKSNLKFNQLKAYRALNLSDMYVLLNKYSDIDMLIFEEIQPDEIDAVKMLASEFSGKTYTFGQIKLEGIENYTCLSDIQDALDNTYSLSTRTYGRERAPLLYSEVYDEYGQLYIESKSEPVLEIEDKNLNVNSDGNEINEGSDNKTDIVYAETDENIKIIEEKESGKDEEKEGYDESEKELENKDNLDDSFSWKEPAAPGVDIEPFEGEDSAENAKPFVWVDEEENKKVEEVKSESVSTEEEKEEVKSEPVNAEEEKEEVKSEPVITDEEKEVKTEYVNPSDDIFADNENKEVVEEVKTEYVSPSDDIFANEYKEDKKVEEVQTEHLNPSDDIFKDESLVTTSEEDKGEKVENEPVSEVQEEIKSEPVLIEVLQEDKDEKVDTEPITESTKEDESEKVETESVVTEVKEEIKTELVEKEVQEEFKSEFTETEVQEEVKSESTETEIQEEVKSESTETEVQEEVKSEPVETEVKEEVIQGDEGEKLDISTESLSPVFTFEPIIDLERLNSFNSLIETDKDLVKTMFSELMYYRETLSKLSNSDVVLRVNNLNSQLSSYQNRIKELESEIELVKNDTSKLDELEKKLKSEQEKYNKLKDESLKELEDLKSKLKTEQESIVTLKSDSLKELNSLKSKLKTEQDNNVKLQNSLTTVQKEVDSLKQKGNDSKSSLDKALAESKLKEEDLLLKNSTLYDSYNLVMDALLKLSQKYMTLFENHNKEISKVQATLSNYKKVLQEKMDLEEKVTDLELENKLHKNKLSETERIANMKLNEFSKVQENLQTKLNDSIHENQNLTLEIDSLTARMESAERQKQKAVSQVDDLLNQINDKNTLIESKDAMIDNLTSQLESVKAQKEDVVELKEAVKVSDIATQELQKEIGRLQILYREQTREIESKDKRIGELTKANSDLKNNAKALSRSISTGSKLELYCKYSGHGFILPVFGSGSYGVTTTAVSIAKKLYADGANVLLMDLDLVSPKCSSYLGLNPLLPKEVGAMTGLTNPMQYTCMGILIQKETDYFIKERDNFIQQVAVNRKTSKRLDFFSGLFGDVEVYKFANVDWDELMNTLGNQYDYIVLDLGRFGGSNEQNALIKMFTTVSLRYLAITTKDKDDIRNMMLKIDMYKLNKKNLIWMLNMASNTQEDEFILRALGQIPHRILTFNDGMFGQKDKGLFTNAIFKGQFNSIVDLLTMKDMK